MCKTGLLLVRACDALGDSVCSACPLGFGCSGNEVATVCQAGTYSTPDGVCIPCAQNYSSDAGAAECVCLYDQETGCSGCPFGTIAVGTQCRQSPDGFGMILGELQLCPRGTYSTNGHCVACGHHAWSEPGALECYCVDGYTRSGEECTVCKAGTVFHDKRCVLCDPGEYCLGKTHHEPCPGDMYSHRGAGMCTPCRMNSGCLRHCVSEANCTCDDGYVDVSGECRRCFPGTKKDWLGECMLCPAGFECKGGADVWQCPLTTWSPGNASSCLECDRCAEITASRCNGTHNSVCERTAVPLGVLDVYQQYTHHGVDGKMFGTFALLYVAAIPKAQLLRVCDKERCVQCFQGLCPDAARMRRLNGPGFELTFEVRNFASRIDDSIELLNHPTHLRELAKTTMHKLTAEPFLFLSRVEHSVICPAGLLWDKTACRERSKKAQRSLMGLLLSVLLLVTMAILGWNGRKWIVELGVCFGCNAVVEDERESLVVDESEVNANKFVSQWGNLQ